MGRRIIRMGHPLAFAAFLRDIGAPAERYLRRGGLPALCEDPDAFVPLESAWSFFDATARGEDPTLGWHVGRFVGDHNLNRAFLSKLERAPTLYEALKQFVRLSSAEASHLQLGIRERGEDIVLYTHYPDMKPVPGYAVSQSYQLGVIIGLIRHFCGEDWMPEEMGIECPFVPTIAKEQFPGSQILARQRAGYIAIARSHLHRAAPHRTSEDSAADPLLLTKDLGYLGTLRVLLRPHLSEGYLDASFAASLMDTSVRTLARRLSEEGLTYREVIDRLRFDEAKHLLEHSSASIIDVAYEIGFEDPSNFARMFRRIGGLSPREFRKV